MYVPPQALSARCDSCAEGNCYLDITRAAKAVNIINLNNLNKVLRRKGKRSDCAILWKSRNIFAVVELKGGQAGIPTEKVVEQLQESLDTIDSIVKDQHVIDYFPILLYRSKDPTTAFRGKRVRFRGQEKRIILGICGSRLNYMLRHQ